MTRWDEMWAYLKRLYEQTDREYTVSAAGWYEQLEPWHLAGIQEKVRQAIERKERDERNRLQGRGEPRKAVAAAG